MGNNVKEIRNNLKETEIKKDEEMDLDKKCKIVFIGDVNEKSKIIDIYLNGNNQNTFFDFTFKNVNINGEDVTLLFYVTAGQEKFRALIPMYLRGADIIIILYNVSIYESFLNVEKKWIKEIEELNMHPLLVLVGTQNDLESNKVVDTKDGEVLAAKYGLLFYEVSIKEEESINILFNNVIFPEMAKKFKIGKKENLQKYLDENSLKKENGKIIDNKEKENIELKELQIQLNNEKNKNNNLINKINQLEKELEEERSKNNKLIAKINELENKSKDNNRNNIKDLLLENLLEKDKEIKELKIKLSRYPFDLNENEKLISIIFTTLNEEIYYSIICKDTDDFSKIENKLFEAFPKFIASEKNYFKINGIKIDKYKNLIGNNIKHNDIIIINFN